MSDAVIRVLPATDTMAADLVALADDASAAGIGNVSRLIAMWSDGSQRYDRAGEQLLVAWLGDDAVGVGGLTWCPDVEGALRVRRFFVASRARRRGIAARIATQLVEHARGHCELITCNAQASLAAPPFWESLGFERSDHAGITHTFALASPPK